MSNTKHEDAILKMGIDYFRSTILKTLGIDYEYVDSGTTELVELSIHSLYMDFTFLTTKDLYIHIEFQSTDSGQKDLRRFHAYESVYAHKTGKNVITYVIYSGQIVKSLSELDCGLYTYRIIPVYLSNEDADSILKYLREKTQQGEFLTDDDFARLALTPLMHSEMNHKDIFKESLLLAKTTDSVTSQKVMAMIYTLADKFLTKQELEEIKEVVLMTKLGQMILDDGVERGLAQGTQQGKEQMSALTAKLLEENRLDDLKKATQDIEFREKLLRELGL